jgi:uncharacterized membrane protein YfcA
MWTTDSLLLVTAVFVLAGGVKGVFGFGLPVVTIAILTATHGLTTAIGLMLVPSFATNVWQAIAGGGFAPLMRRLWTFLAAASIMIWISSGVLAVADAAILTSGLGILLIAYSAVSLATPQIPPPGRHETWLSPLIGAVNGTVTGFTGVFLVPSGLYLQALGLGRDGIVQALGIIFTLSTVMIGAALASRSLVSTDTYALSALAMAPAFAGMFLGQKLRKRIPDARFRSLFFAALIVIGIYLIWRATTL